MKLPRSTYYYRKKPKVPELSDEVIVAEIRRIGETFPSYGYRRMTEALKREGMAVNRKRVYRLMGEHKLLCRRKKRFKVYTTDSNHPYPIHPNRVEGLRIERPDQVWVSDLTYIGLTTGTFVYLAVILDAFSRKVVGYALSRRIDQELALSALKQAIDQRHPSAGCIHHSDRGVQYAAHAYVDLLRVHGFAISMSAKGNPYDNAKAESFMKTLKYDEVYRSEYHSFDEAAQHIVRFIEEVYNTKRLHSAIGYVPPAEFEASLQAFACQRKAVGV